MRRQRAHLLLCERPQKQVAAAASGCDRKLENFVDKAANKTGKKEVGKGSSSWISRRGCRGVGEYGMGKMESEKRDEPQKQTGANRNIMFQQRSHIKNDTPIKFNNLKMKQQKEKVRNGEGREGEREGEEPGGVCCKAGKT